MRSAASFASSWLAFAGLVRSQLTRVLGGTVARAREAVVRRRRAGGRALVVHLGSQPGCRRGARLADRATASCACSPSGRRVAVAAGGSRSIRASASKQKDTALSRDRWSSSGGGAIWASAWPALTQEKRAPRGAVWREAGPAAPRGGSRFRLGRGYARGPVTAGLGVGARSIFVCALVAVRDAG